MARTPEKKKQIRAKAPPKKGQRVSWKWGRSRAEGEVESVSKSRTSRTIKGKRVTKKGSEDNPAVTISQGKGKDNKVLKLASEVDKK